jgi:predicted metal-dependent hydrolase
MDAARNNAYNDKKRMTTENPVYEIVYSKRRTLGISILPDATVIVRAPLRTSQTAIERLIASKQKWINKHVTNIKNRIQTTPPLSFTNGSLHRFKGNNLELNISKSEKRFVRFNDKTIDIGIENPENELIVSKILKQAYKTEAEKVLPEMFYEIIRSYKNYNFKPTALVIRTMKRQWGSCSTKNKITLNSELIKLDEKYIKYVITHELCHLQYHNHGELFYKLLSEFYNDWKTIKKEMKGFSINN